MKRFFFVGLIVAGCYTTPPHFRERCFNNNGYVPVGENSGHCTCYNVKTNRPLFGGICETESEYLIPDNCRSWRKTKKFPVCF